MLFEERVRYSNVFEGILRKHFDVSSLQRVYRLERADCFAHVGSPGSKHALRVCFRLEIVKLARCSVLMRYVQSLTI